MRQSAEAFGGVVDCLGSDGDAPKGGQIQLVFNHLLYLIEITRIYKELSHSEESRSRTSHTEPKPIWFKSPQNITATMKTSLSLLLSTLLLFVLPTFAQFQFFEHMFNQGGQQQQQAQNAASDSSWYKQQYEAGMPLSFNSLGSLLCGHMADQTCPTVHCDKYLCPQTLSCVHFPHHCPCSHPEVEDKVELDDGSMICVSKGGYKAGEAARKIELARKALL